VLNPVIKSECYEIEYERELSFWEKESGLTGKGIKEIAFLESIAVLNEEGMTIFAVNKDREKPLDFRTELRGFAGFKIIEHIVLENDDIHAVNTSKDLFKVQPHNNGNAEISGNEIKASLPVLSWNVIRLFGK
jgi:alpha-L-arabinofuranosidase